MNLLTDTQMRDFARDGYVLVKGVVAEAFLAAADAEIDAFVATDPPAADVVGKHAYSPHPDLLPACDATLRASGALDIANELVAPHTLDHALNHIQIAMTIPPWRHIPGGPHIDGHAHDRTEIASFTMLAGIYLCDETKSATGNLWVWPGSHRNLSRMFRERGVEALLPVDGHPTLLDPAPELGDPIPVLAERGDLLLAHFLLGHNSGGNETNRVRRILYYRLACEDHRTRWRETFLYPLTEYAPLRRFDLGE